MMGWQYTDDWTEEDLTDGHYVGFVYMFYFPDTNDVYFGSKQMYQRVKEVKKLKSDSKENGWRNYTSSSKTVNERISTGEYYTKTILWAFPSMKETLLVESILILTHILDSNCLNLAVINKVRAPSYKDKRRLHGIVQDILNTISMR
ncbi:TPA: hypothetical protein L9M21_004188 [Klebsiella quasipneumoniae subsp. quasipneumoniae]|nr:hypothetical protein [Klebsiella pneumoniae]HBR1695508.1 hypothetical protein [Klebsiella quasipneumoniae subsp. quasipneumoniae]